MKLPHSLPIPFLWALLVPQAMSNRPFNQNQCPGNGAECYKLLSIFGNFPIPRAIVSRDCSSFVQEIVTPQATNTVTVTITAAGSSGGQNPGHGSGPGRGNPGHGPGHQHPPRNIPGIDCDGSLPLYAGGCNNPSYYSSACSCFGVLGTTRTLASQTQTVTQDITVTLQIQSTSNIASTIPISTSASEVTATSALQSSSSPGGSTTSSFPTLTSSSFPVFTSSSVPTLISSSFLSPISGSGNITTSASLQTITVTVTMIVSSLQDPSTSCNCPSLASLITSLSPSSTPSFISITPSSQTSLLSPNTSLNPSSRTSLTPASNTTLVSSQESLFSPQSTPEASTTTTSNNATSPPTFITISSPTLTSSFSTVTSSSTCSGYNPTISTSYQGCLLDPTSPQTFELLDSLTGIPIIDTGSQAVLATTTNDTALGSYHFSQPINAPNGFYDLDYTDSQGVTSVFAVLASGNVGFESASSNGNAFQNGKFITTIWSVQCNGELSAGILCSSQFQYSESGSGIISTNIQLQSNATVGIPYFGLANTTSADELRCPDNGTAVPNLTATNTTIAGACAAVLGLDPPFSNFHDCCKNIGGCYDGITTNGTYDCSTTYSNCNTQFFQCAQSTCSPGNTTDESSIAEAGCQRMANNYKVVLDSFVGQESFKVANAGFCSCE